MLIHVKAMCEVHFYGQPGRVKAFCLLDRAAYQQTLTLDEFVRRQFAQMQSTVIRLKKFLDHVASLAAKACEVSGRRSWCIDVLVRHSERR